MQLPIWLTLGGVAVENSAGSDWLSALVAFLNIICYTLVLLIAQVFFAAAKKSLTVYGRKAKYTLGLLFVFGGFATLLMPVIMMYYPVWSLHVFFRCLVIVLCVSTLHQLRHLRLVFARSEAAVKAVHNINNVITAMDGMARAEMREKLIKISNELSGISHNES